MRTLKRIYRTLKAIPLIWNDRWWDHYYLEKMIVWKLRDMAENFEKHGMAVCSKKHAMEMKIVANHLERVMEERDSDEYLETIGLVDDPTIALGKRLADNYSTERHIEIEKELQKRREKVFRIIGKRLPHWWD